MHPQKAIAGVMPMGSVATDKAVMGVAFPTTKCYPAGNRRGQEARWRFVTDRM